jgi:competence protein ComEA
MAPDDEGLQPLVPRPSSSELWARWTRLRHDPRAGAVLLALVALVAGWFWYRTSLRSGALEPSLVGAGSTTTASPAASAGAGPADAAGATSAPSSGTPGGAPPAGGSGAASPGDPAAGAGAATTLAPGLVVHVAGGVVRPGVYRLPPGARVDDAITAAGGAVAGVDVDAVNRAAPLVDGQRVRVPLPGEPVPPPDPLPTPAAGPSTGPVATSPPPPVNLNTASVAELETLPGVGPTIAAAIVEERTRRGGFASVRDLLDVRGIGESRLLQLEPLVTV